MEDSTETIEKFYEQLGLLVSSFKSKNNWIVVMGDFNGRIGVKLDGEDQVMGDWGFGERNECGKRIINFCSSQRLTIVNSFFKKRAKAKWAWCSPKGHKFELDYFLTNQTNLVKNLEIINSFNFNTDYRLLRVELNVEKFKEKRPFKVKKKTVILQEQIQIEKFCRDFSKYIENSQTCREENTSFTV
ncbi:craniofacial development protein 2-like [Halyomorpha halys]|uniref:craniofacial development protein 2-like n=1 Tax=Halyomorpha halys TaxID=286706 RepID=UPI0034D386F0